MLNEQSSFHFNEMVIIEFKVMKWLVLVSLNDVWGFKCMHNLNQEIKKDKCYLNNNLLRQSKYTNI